MSSFAHTATGNAVALPLGAVSSLALHAGLAAALLWAIAPAQRPPQEVPQSELSIEAYRVARSEAAETRPDPEAARQDRAEGEALGAGAVPKDRARPAPPAAEAAPVAAALPEAAEAATPEGEALRAAAPESDGLREVPPPAETAAATLPETAGLAAASPEAEAVAAAEPEARPAEALAPAAEAVAAAGAIPERVDSTAAPILPVAVAVTPAAPVVVAAAPAVQPVAVAAPVVAPAVPPAQLPAQPPLAPAVAERAEAPRAETPRETAPAAAPPAEAAEAAPPPAVPAADAPPRTEEAPAADLPAERGRATLAPIGPDGQLDPKSLDAVAALTEATDLGSAAEAMRDGILGLLGSVPCSRLQVAYDPDTGEMVLAGNVPDASLAEGIAAGLRDRIGAGIPVRANLQVLPEPQCGALAGMDEIGLPQSADQITNKKVLGPDGAVLETRTAGGQPLDIFLAGADYDAWLYVDYFMADGQVLHLIPNDEIPHTFLRAFEETDLLRAKQGRGPLGLVVGPPYGTELVVAYVSTSQLYEGLRPLVEPAETYFPFLKDRIARTRADDPAFKGEWIYYLSITHE